MNYLTSKKGLGEKKHLVANTNYFVFSQPLCKIQVKYWETHLFISNQIPYKIWTIYLVKYYQGLWLVMCKDKWDLLTTYGLETIYYLDNLWVRKVFFWLIYISSGRDWLMNPSCPILKGEELFEFFKHFAFGPFICWI